MKLPFATSPAIGSRATLGLIVLQADETIEPEMAQMTAQDGVSLYHSRIRMAAEITPETLATMLDGIPGSTDLLPGIDFDVIGYACTSGATVIGPENVARAVQSARPSAKVTDPVTATIAALRHLGAKRIGFVTPYVAEVSAAMRGLLEREGFEIAAFASFEEGDDRVVARIAPQSIKAAILAVNNMADCDAIFVSCTNLRVLGIAAETEVEIGRPVISSNIALGWHMLHLAGLTAPHALEARLFKSQNL